MTAPRDAVLTGVRPPRGKRPAGHRRAACRDRCFREESRRRLGLDDRPAVLLSFGGIGLDAIRAYGVSGSDYVGKHPQPPAHKAYAEGIVRAIRGL